MLKLWAAALLMTAAMTYGAIALTAQSDAAWKASVASADVHASK